MDTSQEIRPLTSLRFIAALLVFLSHFGGYTYGRAAQAWQSIIIEGHAGVTIFFALSGFLITLRYFPDIQAHRFSPYQYFLRRAARILPLYWTVMALSLLLSPVTSVKVFAPFPLANWTLTQSYFSGLATTFIIAGWSLAVEEVFYLLAPVILHFCAAFGQDARPVFMTLALWSLGLFGAGLLFVWIANYTSLNQPYGFMNDFGFMVLQTIFGRGFNFCVGIFLAWLYLKHRDTLWARPSTSRQATLLFILSALGIVSCQIVMNDIGGAIVGWPFNQAIALFAGFMILSLTCPSAPVARIMSQKLPVYLGRTSYALYLWQTSTIGLSIYYYLLLPSLGLLAMPAYFLVLTDLSAFCYKVIERPVRNLILGAGLSLRRAFA